MKILLTVAYDGTEYAGWQRQKKEKTVQAELEKALSYLFRREILIKGASRTDSGVHALAQKASFEIDVCKIPLNKFPKVINRCLPKDIAVNSAVEVSQNFNVRYDVIEKTYIYKIATNKEINPLTERYCLRIDQNLDIEAMKKATKFFVGSHDFVGFSSTGSSIKSTIREIYSLNITEDKGYIEIKITGKSFLYNMVRIIVGTLINVAINKEDYKNIPKIIESKDRERAGKTAEAKGLCLLETKYRTI